MPMVPYGVKGRSSFGARDSGLGVKKESRFHSMLQSGSMTAHSSSGDRRGSTAGGEAQPAWIAVDRYAEPRLAPGDRALEGALARSEAAGLPGINVTATMGKFLHLLARIAGARRILELGTLGGYSTIWLARALPPGGRLITIEADPAVAETARANLVDAGLTDVVELRVGRALDELPRIEAEGGGPFDLVFVDADKPSTPRYWNGRCGCRGRAASSSSTT